LRIFSPEPSAIRSRFALMLAYKPFGFFAIYHPQKIVIDAVPGKVT
jgi:hypothetical protein